MNPWNKPYYPQPRQLPQFHQDIPISSFCVWRHNRIIRRSTSFTVASVSNENLHPNLRANLFPSSRDTFRSVPTRTIPTRTIWKGGEVFWILSWIELLVGWSRGDVTKIYDSFSVKDQSICRFIQTGYLMHVYCAMFVINYSFFFGWILLLKNKYLFFDKYCPGIVTGMGCFLPLQNPGAEWNSRFQRRGPPERPAWAVSWWGMIYTRLTRKTGDNFRRANCSNALELLLQKPKIIICDGAIAALHTETNKDHQKALKISFDRWTVLVIE